MTRQILKGRISRMMPFIAVVCFAGLITYRVLALGCSEEATYQKILNQCATSPDCWCYTWKDGNGNCKRMMCKASSDSTLECKTDTAAGQVTVTKYRYFGTCNGSTCTISGCVDASTQSGCSAYIGSYGSSVTDYQTYTGVCQSS